MPHSTRAKLIAIGLLSILALACQEASPVRKVEVVRISRMIMQTQGALVMGKVRLPSGLISDNAGHLISDNAGHLISNNSASYRVLSLCPFVAPPKATVSLRDAKGAPLPGFPPVEADGDGDFSFTGVPTDEPLLVEATIEANGKALTLIKFIRPTEALACANVDLASTLVAEKLLSKDPFPSPPPELVNLGPQDLLALADPKKLEKAETIVRAALCGPEAPTLEMILGAFGSGDKGELLAQLIQIAPGAGQAIQEALTDGEASVGLRLASVPDNAATIPGSDQPTVFGVLRVKTEGAPAGTQRVEYWLNLTKAGESIEGASWEAAVDTWRVPDGPYTFKTVAFLDERRRVTLNSTFLNVRNTLDMHCPAP